MRFTPVRAVTAAAFTSLALVAASLPAAQAAPGTSTDPATEATVSAAAGTSIRFATFNVRTARADRGTSRSWLNRASSVAREIDSRSPGIVAVQELGPGRADGAATKLNGATRQTEHLVKALAARGAGHYKLARVTAYVAPGTAHATQGTRILYDIRKFRLVSDCRETTGKSNYSSTCNISLPVGPGDTQTDSRSAAYAEFEDRGTGRNFFVISAHLDSRHGGTSRERQLDDLREAQVRTVYNRVAGLADGKPILFGGDINSWRTKAGRHAPFDFLAGRGFRDATTAPTRVDSEYPTVNHWKPTLKKNAAGRQVALDVVMVKGVSSFSRYENVMKVSDPSRPSDHNMVVSDLVL